MENFQVSPGYIIKGTTVLDKGVNFGIFSRNATKMTLEIFENLSDNEPIFSYDLDPKRNRTGDTWHVYILGINENYSYSWRADGPFVPRLGHRFDYNKRLIDPYAKAITPKYLCENTFMKNLIVNERKLLELEREEVPGTEFKETVIYEMHIRLFTMNKNSNVENPGTYKGVVEKINYLKELGVTAIELLPIFAFDSEDTFTINPFTGEKLKNIWGYNPIAFFTPTPRYSNQTDILTFVGGHIIEFRNLVKEFHKAGIEVILDVVFNHTEEGNENGTTVSFKGLDNSIYYLLSQKDKRYYCNYSGTGNTINASHAVVKELIIASLRYWYAMMLVDGFRFDLAAILGRDENGNWIGDLSLLKDIADDSVISGAKLIAEGWDAAGGYFLGEFPCGWAEWNGKFRDTVRKFIKGDPGQVSDLATRVIGSPDLFSKYGRKPYHGINFITAHDGFTMWDLVSYNEKHNLANGEDNRDGENNNNSWNHGIEGETDDPNIIALRKKQMKNMVVILMISQGVPMILMGDEMAKTQNGNNNAYCQDNDTNWIDWDRKEKFIDIFNFFKNMINFRKIHKALKREKFFSDSDLDGNGYTDISWHGLYPEKPDWSYESRVLAFMIDGGDINGTDEDNDIYVALNSHYEPLTFYLPYIPGKKWYRVVDTSEPTEDFLEIPLVIEDNKYLVKDRSSIVLISK
ncbi:MAG: isoamylase [Cetobacterium sp.]